MTEITAEVVGPVDRPPVPTETPEVWAVFRWYWYEYLQSWQFAISGTYASRESSEKYLNPGDILIRIPASGSPTPKREHWAISQNSDGSIGMRKELPKGGAK